MARHDTYSVRLVQETLEFLRRSLGVSGAIFYWIDRDLDVTNDTIAGTPEGMVDHYRREMRDYDPLLASRLVEQRRHFALLSVEAPQEPQDSFRRYESFMSAYQMLDNLDFVFWADEQAYAGVSLMRHPGDRDLPTEDAQLEAWHRYIQFNLQNHSRVKSMRLHTILRRQWGLTARECELTELISRGASNQDIADSTGLRLTTVKSYVQSIFDKMGTNNRTTLSARLGRLAGP